MMPQLRPLGQETYQRFCAFLFLLVFVTVFIGVWGEKMEIVKNQHETPINIVN